jgi:uncharacterized protein (TIGR00255 family)
MIFLKSTKILPQLLYAIFAAKPISMLKSMTGYGQQTDYFNGKQISVELRTLNSRSLDANLRLPTGYRELEPEIRTMLQNKVERGKTDLYLSIQAEQNFSEYKVNHALAKHYLNEVSKIASESGLELTSEIFASVLRFPDVIQQDSSSVSDDEKLFILQLLSAGIDKLDRHRASEGKVLEQDFAGRINLIMQYLEQIEPLEQKRIEDIRQRLQLDLAQLEQRMQIDSNRFEQEVIYYLEKIDFTEEKIRLKKHCLDFLKTMSEEIAQGRKLGFISQEIGREINTLGSKAYNADIQKIVVEMKNELEKVKEQLLNIL